MTAWSIWCYDTKRERLCLVTADWRTLHIESAQVIKALQKAGLLPEEEEAW